MRLMNNVQFGTLGGTVCSMWSSFDLGNMVQTAVLAAIGAAVSYLVSRLLDGRRRRRR